MIELGLRQRDIVYNLCKDSKEILVRSAADGRMGRIWVGKTDSPTCCLISVGEFAYLLGLPPRGEKALNFRATLIKECNKKMIVPENEAWSKWLEENMDCSYREMSRYALFHRESSFDLEVLQSFIQALPEGFELRLIGEKEYQDAQSYEWSSDFAGDYKSYGDFLENGLGYVIYKDGELVSGCSAFGFSVGYLEVVVVTKAGFKRMGLGIAACASFIRKCVENDVYPNWDAANVHSAELAQKLGYEFEREYKVYQINEKTDIDAL